MTSAYSGRIGTPFAFFSGAAARWADPAGFEDEDIVGTQSAKKVDDAGAQSRQQRRDRNDGGDADDDAEDGEHGAEAVSPDGATWPWRWFSRGEMFIGYSALRATIGSSLAARDAGYQPLTMPTAPETNTESEDIERRDAQRDAEGDGERGGERRADRLRRCRRPRRHEHGFNQNLAHDVGAPRAQRFANADFACPLGDAHQHDVHDDDAADDERNQRHRHHHRRDQARATVDKAADGVGRQDIEAVLLARLLMEAGAESDAGRVERPAAWEAARWPGAGEDVDAVAGAEEAVKDGDRDIGGVVLAVAERGAEPFQYADHR